MITPNYSSYRDPAARVVEKTDGWYRYVFKNYQEEYDHLIRSGLYKELADKELLISHLEIDPDDQDPSIYRMLRPQQIGFQSYPFEWSYRQWIKVLLALLDINTIALKYGMILKDATPFNFYLSKGKAILIDTTSFILFRDNDPWIAYRQFCEELLGPIALMRYNGVQWSKLTSAGIRGLSLPFIAKQLPWRSRLNLTCLLHIHVHARYTGKQGKAKKGFTVEKLLSLFSMIRQAITAWDKPRGFNGQWANYYEEGDETYIKAKENIITHWLAELKPATVIDLGANAGRFAFIAAKHASSVIVIDRDAGCIDMAEKAIEKNSLKNVTVLVADLAQPSPALGVMNKEYPSLLERGRSDMALGLALVHHLCIDMNISMAQVAEIFSALAEKYAIVEFVLADDDKAAQLIANRGGIFTGYSEDLFITAFSMYFDQVGETEVVSTRRKLFLFKKRAI